MAGTRSSREFAELQQELQQTRQELAELRSLVESLAPKAATVRQPSGGAAPVVQDSVGGAVSHARTSRRRLMKVAGAASAGVAAAALAKPATAAAADPNDITKDVDNLVTTGLTQVSTEVPINSGNLFTANTTAFSPSASSFRAALGGWSNGGDFGNGVYGFVGGRDDSNTRTGHALVASSSVDGRSHILLEGGLDDPRLTSISHAYGEIVFDGDTGSMWFCVASGAPGTWRKLAGPATAGAFHAITPKRVWDSRQQGGALVNDESRVVSIKDGRVLESSTIDVPDLVPEGATAISFNLAVISTGSSGYLAVTPGDAADFSAASINWNGAGSVLNNGTMSTVSSSREVKVWCRGTAQAVIDVTGYFL